MLHGEEVSFSTEEGLKYCHSDQLLALYEIDWAKGVEEELDCL